MVKKYENWIIVLLLDWDGPASYEELRNTMTAQGARPHSGDIKESCEELTRRGVLEEGSAPNSGSTQYTISGLGPLVRYHVEEQGPVDAAGIHEENSRKLPDVSRVEVEAALDTLLEQGEVVEVADGKYDVSG